MFNIVLFEPEIPPNTGNIIRLCVNTGCKLHLIQPLGFSLSEKHLKRANLDYEMSTPPLLYPSFAAYQQNATINQSTLYLCTTKAETLYTDVHFKPGDSMVFGPETRGLPNEILMQYTNAQKILIPMQPEARSLNLSNAVAIVVYEAWRQQGFRNLKF
jgi:tRNA (cytidine/uridine-2'-O-)-methyltransferase